MYHIIVMLEKSQHGQSYLHVTNKVIIDWIKRGQIPLKKLPFDSYIKCFKSWVFLWLMNIIYNTFLYWILCNVQKNRFHVTIRLSFIYLCCLWEPQILYLQSIFFWLIIRIVMSWSRTQQWQLQDNDQEPSG